MFLYYLYFNQPTGIERAFDVLLNIKDKMIFTKFNELFKNDNP